MHAHMFAYQNVINRAHIAEHERMFWNVRAIPVRLFQGLLTDQAGAIEQHFPAGNGVNASDRVEERLFSSPVWTDQPGDHAFPA